jgi:colanic acid/amylovoran biosynthesis glycosyltransferase
MNSLVMVHPNPVRIDGDMLTVDRKFHSGMLAYAEKIKAPLVTIHPQANGAAVLDPVTVPLGDLPYDIRTTQFRRDWQPTAEAVDAIRREVERARLVYTYGHGMGVPPIARDRGVPYVLTVEYDLKTEITATAMQVKNPLRRAVRAARTVWHYNAVTLPAMRGAHSLHCSGFPIFDVARREGLKSLLYLDSRMSADMMMSHDGVYRRLSKHRGYALKLLYSGRYEPLEGALDAVQVAASCLKQGIDVEMHCYGRGSLAPQMRQIASRYGGSRIVIHDAVPYHELVQIARGFDVFVCCRVQSDPSCTYLESMGAGLPIVGYANRMWERLREDSGAGFCSPMGKPHLVAKDIGRLAHHAVLAAKSVAALEYARSHSHEIEHGKRIEALNQALEEVATCARV